MNFTFLVVVLLTALAFVGVVIALSRAISPRSYNLQKFEAYECGIPTRGKSWMQFRVGYYLFAILFLMFDVETVFLYPWTTPAAACDPAAYPDDHAHCRLYPPQVPSISRSSPAK